MGQQIAAGVDLFIVETFYSVEEASLGLPYIKSAGVPAVVTLEYKSGEYTADRYLPDEAVKRLVDHGADVVGVNCGRPWYMYRDILRKMMGAVSAPICAQPLAYVLENGAEYTREIASGSSVHFELRHQPRREMADYARDAWDMGLLRGPAVPHRWPRRSGNRRQCRISPVSASVTAYPGRRKT